MKINLLGHEIELLVGNYDDAYINVSAGVIKVPNYYSDEEGVKIDFEADKLMLNIISTILNYLDSISAIGSDEIGARLIQEFYTDEYDNIWQWINGYDVDDVDYDFEFDDFNLEDCDYDE